MATRFEVGVSVMTTPRGVLVRTRTGEKLLANGLNQRISPNAELLIAKNEAGSRVIARKR